MLFRRPIPVRRRAPVAAALLFAAPFLAVALGTTLPAGAAPLEPEACAGLKIERQGLIADGVKTDMAKGPEWGKANLPVERLGKIERLIAVEEQLSFRCDELVTAKPQMKERPPKPAKDQGDKQAANPAGDAAAEAGATAAAGGTTGSTTAGDASGAPKAAKKNKTATKKKAKPETVD